MNVTGNSVYGLGFTEMDMVQAARPTQLSHVWGWRSEIDNPETAYRFATPRYSPTTTGSVKLQR